VIAGNSRTRDGQNLVLRAYDTVSGELRWTDETPQYAGVTTGVFATTVGGTAFVTGYSASVACCSDILVRAYNADDGQVLWTDVWDKGRDDLPEGIAATPDAVVVVGYGGNTLSAPISGLDLLVRAYSPANGQVLWQDRVDKGFLVDDAAWDVTIDGSRVFVVGTTGISGGETDLIVRAYDLMTGALLWEAPHRNTSPPIVFFVEEGQVWVSGSDYLLVFDGTSGKLVLQLP
jgi:glucose dehydrogenase